MDLTEVNRYNKIAETVDIVGDDEKGIGRGELI